MGQLLDRALLWFRRDLRVDDHAALYHALRSARQVWCAFVFDRDILDALPRSDRRVEFIRDSLVGLDAQLRALGSAHGIDGCGLIVRHGFAVDEIAALAALLQVQAVYANHDDDPAALARDARVRGRLPTSAWHCTARRTTSSSSAASCSAPAARRMACSRPTRPRG